MPKIIKVESCKKCDLSHKNKVKLNCPMVGIPEYGLPCVIHSKCPLEDYKPEIK